MGISGFGDFTKWIQDKKFMGIVWEFIGSKLSGKHLQFANWKDPPCYENG